jgi:nitrogen-specific signal transduction histidine kinase
LSIQATQGAGIPEDIQNYFFKDTLTTKKDGNGMGLLSGKGTTFHFTLPTDVEM